MPRGLPRGGGGMGGFGIDRYIIEEVNLQIPEVRTVSLDRKQLI